MKRYKFSFYNPDSPIDPIGSFLDQFPIEDFPLEENIPIDSSSLPSEFEKEFQSIDPFKGPQAPIKSHWETSGTFSLSPTNSRHPKGHLGVDLRAPGGTSIYPFAPGIVTYVGTDNKGGYVVKIDHEKGFKTYYAHCGTIMVKKGDKVDCNTPIATVGDSGNAKGTSPHLHFQVSQNGSVQDPAQYFTVPKYTDLRKGELSWMSQDARNKAYAFNIDKHNATKPIAPVSPIDMNKPIDMAMAKTTDPVKSILNANFINRLAKKYGS